MRGSSHIRSILIGVKYRNCRRTLDVYLLADTYFDRANSIKINLQTGNLHYSPLMLASLESKS